MFIWIFVVKECGGKWYPKDEIICCKQVPHKRSYAVRCCGNVVVASRRHPIVCVWINIPGLRKHRYHYAKYFDVKRSHTQASALPKPLATGMLRMKQDGDAGIFLHAKTEDMTI
ncbi:hypothetical protein LSAT2_026103 [Lamellibrachia satsuma]|nr:hypothetical protein LSAT2_026103 [Lamellibrachia satsuma]